MKQTEESPKKDKKEKKKVQPVDCNNDAELVELGIRNPDLKPRDPSVWSKTVKQKKEARRMKSIVNNPDIPWAAPDPESKTFGRLTVHIRFNKNAKGCRFDRTTYTHENVGDQDVFYMIRKYKTTQSSPIKAFYCGKEVNLDNLCKE